MKWKTPHRVHLHLNAPRVPSRQTLLQREFVRRTSLERASQIKAASRIADERAARAFKAKQFKAEADKTRRIKTDALNRAVKSGRPYAVMLLASQAKARRADAVDANKKYQARATETANQARARVRNHAKATMTATEYAVFMDAMDTSHRRAVRREMDIRAKSPVPCIPRPEGGAKTRPSGVKRRFIPFCD